MCAGGIWCGVMVVVWEVSSVMGVVVACVLKAPGVMWVAVGGGK